MYVENKVVVYGVFIVRGLLKHFFQNVWHHLLITSLPDELLMEKEAAMASFQHEEYMYVQLVIAPTHMYMYDVTD